MLEPSHSLSNLQSTPLWRRGKQYCGRFLVSRLPISRHVFDQIRLELNVLYVRATCVFDIRYWKTLRRLRKASNLAVNIGCGGSGNTEWVNLDLMNHAHLTLRYDCRRRLPLTDGSVKAIRCEHFLEHLSVEDEVPELLRSCYRVLSSGGVLRIVVPDTKKYLLAYASGDIETWRDLGWDLNAMPAGFYTPLDAINHVFRQGHEHKYAYDFNTLAERLRQAGFDQICQMRFGESHSSLLRDDLPNHKPYSLYVEAVR